MKGKERCEQIMELNRQKIMEKANEVRANGATIQIDESRALILLYNTKEQSFIYADESYEEILSTVPDDLEDIREDFILVNHMPLA